jgi:hypothetical protein
MTSIASDDNNFIDYKEKFCLSRVSPTPPYFFEFIFFIYLKLRNIYISNFADRCNITTRMWEKYFNFFFAKFNFFKYLKFNKNCFKKYIYSVIKIPNCFSHNLSEMFEWTAKFQIQMLYRVRDTKKRSCLRGQKKD